MGDGDVDALIGQTLGKKFLVRRKLGAGGMGAVYEAEHVLTKRVGALKLLHEHAALSGVIVRRFLREASAAGRIGNPHIVETIDAGELLDGQPYIFMELLLGTPVSELIRRRGRLSFQEAREIVLQAATGLAAAHAAGIVHRDIKPENVFLCSGETAQVKLLDFGISKFETITSEHRLTAEGAPMGTPYYMSPEQVAGKRDLGPASDIYSLGVVLYECVTGSVPFEADTLPALSIKIFQGNYAPPSTLLGRAAPGLDAVIARALSTAPSERYANMRELQQALLQLEPGAPISRSKTLKNPAAALDETADLATSTGASAITDRPPTLEPSTTPLDAMPGTLQSEPRRGLGKLWLVAGLAGIALGIASWSRAPRPAPQPLRDPHPASAEAASPEPSAPAPVQPTPNIDPAPSTAASHQAAPLKAPPRAASAPPPSRSKAARDGLSEQNPFAE